MAHVPLVHYHCSSVIKLNGGTACWLLATDHVILNHGQVTWTTPELAPPLLTSSPHQREDVTALDRFNVHRCPRRWVFSGTGLELVTRQATIRYLYHGHSVEPEKMGKKSESKNNSNIATEEKFIRLKDSIKGALTRLETFTSEKTVSKDTSVTEIEIKLKKIEQLQINLDKIAEDYCEIETSESLEIIQPDIEDINQRFETTEVGLKLLMYSLKNTENVNVNLNDNGKHSIRLP
ncbi:integrase catalytic domain-containing protein [Trichonephila clavipes]|nr:integrase catalytic domain-containing protein [Trichonephila clavipes]